MFSQRIRTNFSSVCVLLCKFLCGLRSLYSRVSYFKGEYIYIYLDIDTSLLYYTYYNNYGKYQYRFIYIASAIYRILLNLFTVIYTHKPHLGTDLYENFIAW